MVDLQGAAVPESEEEWELFQDLYAVTGYAHRQGVEREEILAMMNFVAVSITAHAEKDFPDPKSASSEPSGGVESGCPDCGGDIGRVVNQLGGKARIEPCGCTVDYDELTEEDHG